MIRINTLLKTFSSAKQWVDPPSVVLSQIDKLVQLLESAKHPIIFTGAGISTSIGIPDYRSGAQTVVKTGPGIWNRTQKPPVQDIVDLAQPSLTHMAIKTLLRQGIIKHLVSQNTDGIHVRSGIDPSSISQLHGNRNHEKCRTCNTHYYRDFRTLSKGSQKHKTGRKCQNCNGDLYDTIVYFGQKLSKEQLEKAFQEALQADFCLCLGSSLTVKPSSNVPKIVQQRNGHLVIVNIQQTPFDNLSSLKIHDFSDSVMKMVMKKLNMEIDPYSVSHYLELKVQGDEIKGQARDKNGKKFSFINQIDYIQNGEGKTVTVENGHQFTIPLTDQFNIVFFPSFRQKQIIKKPLKIELPIIKRLKQLSSSRVLLKATLTNDSWCVSVDNV